MKPEMMYEEILVTVSDCDHDWQAQSFDATKDHYHAGLHKIWVAEVCETCGGLRYQAWKTDTFPAQRFTMNNYPDGVTGYMIERAQGGPEDEDVEIPLLNSNEVLIVTLSNEGNLLLQVLDLGDDEKIVKELEFSLGGGRELADAIIAKVT